MKRAHPYEKADQYMGPRYLVCFNIGILELLLGKTPSSVILMFLLRLWKLVRELKLHDQKGAFFEGELKIASHKRGQVLLTYGGYRA